MSRADLFAILQRNLQHGALCAGILVLGETISRTAGARRLMDESAIIGVKSTLAGQPNSSILLSSPLFLVLEMMERSEGESRFSKLRRNTEK